MLITLLYKLLSTLSIYTNLIIIYFNVYNNNIQCIYIFISHTNNKYHYFI